MSRGASESGYSGITGSAGTGAIPLATAAARPTGGTGTIPPLREPFKNPFKGDTYVRDQLDGAQGGGTGGDAAAKLAESMAAMSKLADALNNMPRILKVELKQEGRVIIALDNQFTPMMKDYFESWYQEKLNGEGGARADGQITDPSMTNQANNVT